MKSGTLLIGLAMFLITFPSLAVAAKTHVVKKNDSSIFPLQEISCVGSGFQICQQPR